MLHGDALGLFLGAIGLGAVHGVEPGHGWPVAASYALDQTNKWVYGFAASLIIGVGHLVSSIAMVGVFFYAKGYFDLTQVDEPITVLGGIEIGGPVSLVAGVLLIALGIREYFHGHSHGSHDDHDSHGDHRGSDRGHHDHTDEHERDSGAEHSHVRDSEHSHGSDHRHAHSSDHDVHDDGHSDDDQVHGDPVHGDDYSSLPDHSHDDDGGRGSRLAGLVPFVGGHSHGHGDPEAAADRGLFGIAWFAFVLGFAHEEEFEIIALCAGSTHCLELMTAYALTVIVGIVGLTMLLIAGYEHYEERVERYTPYLPVFSAVVLIVMGTGFVVGLF